MFYPGGGRPKGALNHATRELKQELQRFFTSPEYREHEQRIIAGTAPTVEIYLLQMLYGKPKENMERPSLVASKSLSSLSTEELALRAADLMNQLREAQQLEDELAQHAAPKSRKSRRSQSQCRSQRKTPRRWMKWRPRHARSRS